MVDGVRSGYAARMLYVLGAVLVTLLVLAFLILSWWGFAVVLVLGLLFAAYIAAARRKNPNIGRLEQARREPTGRPRAATSNPDTANRRTGQE